MRSLNRLMLCGLALAWVGLANSVKADTVSDVLGCREDPCVIHFNPGGFVVMFEDAAKAIERGARSRVVIDGDCYSSCTLLLERVRDKACLTVWARLYFHRGMRRHFEGYSIPLDGDMTHATPQFSLKHVDLDYHLPEVVGWIHQIGGLPKEGQFVLMPTALAHTIWRNCESPAARLPQPWPHKARMQTAGFAAHGLY